MNEEENSKWEDIVHHYTGHIWDDENDAEGPWVLLALFALLATWSGFAFIIITQLW